MAKILFSILAINLFFKLKSLLFVCLLQENLSKKTLFLHKLNNRRFATVVTIRFYEIGSGR